MAVLVYVDDGGGVVGESKVQSSPDALAGYLSHLPSEDGRLVDAPLPEAVDAPVVRVGILQAFYLCDGGRIEVGVVLVGRAEE